MLESPDMITLALSKGRIFDETLPLLQAAGIQVLDDPEKTRKLMPRGYEAPEDRAEFLLYEGLHAAMELPASRAFEPGFADICLTHFKATWPISQWIVTEL